jgi:hypothetical protein
MTERRKLILDARRLRLKGLERHRLDRQYADGYRRKPENTAWASATTRLLSRVLPLEKW